MISSTKYSPACFLLRLFLIAFLALRNQQGASASCVPSTVSRPELRSAFLLPTRKPVGPSISSFVQVEATARKCLQRLKAKNSKRLVPTSPILSSLSSIIILGSISTQSAMLVQPAALAATCWILARWTDSKISNKDAEP